MNKYEVPLVVSRLNLNLCLSSHPSKTNAMLASPILTFSDTAVIIKPAHLILVLDVSHSMKGNSLTKLKEACAVLIDTLSEQDRLTIVTFDCNATTQYDGVVEDKKKAHRKLTAITTGHGTSVGQGMLEALKAIQSQDIRRTTVVLVSDGADSKNRIKPSKVVNQYKKRLNGLLPAIVAFGLGDQYEARTFIRYVDEADAVYVHLKNEEEFLPQIRNIIPLLSGSQLVIMSYRCPLGQTTGQIRFGNVGFDEPHSTLIEIPRAAAGKTELQLDYDIAAIDGIHHLIRFKITFDPEEIKTLDYDVVAQFVTREFIKVSKEGHSFILQLVAYANLLKLLPADELSPNYAPSIRKIILAAIERLNSTETNEEKTDFGRNNTAMDAALSSGLYASKFVKTSIRVRKNQTGINAAFDYRSLTFMIANRPHTLITSKSNIKNIPAHSFLLLNNHRQDRLFTVVTIDLTNMDLLRDSNKLEELFQASKACFSKGTEMRTCNSDFYRIRIEYNLLDNFCMEGDEYYQIDLLKIIEDYPELATHIDMVLVMATQLRKAIDAKKIKSGDIHVFSALSVSNTEHYFCVYETEDACYILDPILDTIYNLKNEDDRAVIQMKYIQNSLGGLLDELFVKKGYKNSLILDVDFDTSLSQKIDTEFEPTHTISTAYRVPCDTGRLSTNEEDEQKGVYYI